MNHLECNKNRTGERSGREERGGERKRLAPPEAARQILEIAVVEMEFGEVQELCEALRQPTSIEQYSMRRAVIDTSTD